MFQHGSLREVVDHENEPCGCPPPADAAHGNEFPLAQSEGLAPLPKAAPPVVQSGNASAKPLETLAYNGAEHATQSVADPTPITPSAVASQPATPPAVQKKKGFLASVGRFFRRIFGAE
jgi:hypothetical protein